MNKLALLLPIAFLIGCGTDNAHETSYATSSANKPSMEANLSDEPYQGQYVRSFGKPRINRLLRPKGLRWTALQAPPSARPSSRSVTLTLCDEVPLQRLLSSGANDLGAVFMPPRTFKHASGVLAPTGEFPRILRSGSDSVLSGTIRFGYDLSLEIQNRQRYPSI